MFDVYGMEKIGELYSFKYQLIDIIKQKMVYAKQLDEPEMKDVYQNLINDIESLELFFRQMSEASRELSSEGEFLINHFRIQFEENLDKNKKFK